MRNMVYKKHLGKDRHKLEMAPLVDVVFQLLIFFLVATEMRPTEADFKTNLPGQGAGPLDMKEKKPDVHRVFLETSDQGNAVFVTLDNYKKLGYMRADKHSDFLEGRAFSDLQDALRAAVEASGKDSVFMLVINGTPDTRIKFIAGALDAAKAARVPRITFRGLN